jgi:hypothetical protein
VKSPERWNWGRRSEEIFKRKIIPQGKKSARLVVDRKQCSIRFYIIHKG